MSAGRSAALVRRWVALYTLGLPADLKQGRRDEILGGLWMLAAATIGLAFVAADRIRPVIAAIGVLGALIGVVSVLGAYAAIVALPIASAIVLSELGRIGAIGPWVARAHIISAALVLNAAGLVWLPGFLDNPATAVPALSLREFVERRAVFDLVGFPYRLSWITIGWSLLRTSIKTSPPASA
jgi:hypothetical protein